MSLVEVIEQFQAVSDEQRIKLETIYSDLKENEADSIAGTILQQIDRGEVETKKDLTLGEDGVWMEIEEDGTKIGPVDRDHNPTEGHPEYLTVDLSEATMAETTVQLPKPIFADTADVLSSLEKALVPPAFIPATQPGPLTTSQSQPELQEVFLETEMGDLLFEPEEAFLANRSFVMVFDTNRSKPPLYPRVGSKFRLKYNRENYPVSYMDTSFSYKNRKFVVFIILDEEY